MVSCQHEYKEVRAHLETDSGRRYAILQCPNCGDSYGCWDGSTERGPANFPPVETAAEEIYAKDVASVEAHHFVTETFEVIGGITRYLARHPAKLSELTPREFDALLMDALRDFGFESHLSGVRREGGRDIYGFVRNAVTSFLLFVERRRWASERPVAIEIVQRIEAAPKAGDARKRIALTTEFFRTPTRDRHDRVSIDLEAKDYAEFKTWLERWAAAGWLQGANAGNGVRLRA